MTGESIMPGGACMIVQFGPSSGWFHMSRQRRWLFIKGEVMKVAEMWKPLNPCCLSAGDWVEACRRHVDDLLLWTVMAEH